MIVWVPGEETAFCGADETAAGVVGMVDKDAPGAGVFDNGGYD